jgi:hypothetical protein
MLRRSKNIYDLSVNQTPDRPVHIPYNIPTELTHVVEFSMKHPVIFTDFRKLRSSLVVHPLRVKVNAKVKVKVKQSRYRPGVAQRVPGS